MDLFIVVATQSNYIFPIKQAAWLLGQVMNWIFNFLDMFGVGNIGLSIILFTIIVNLILLPMTIKQQKYTKLNSVMMPEIQAIQAKYKSAGNDQEAMMRQNREIQEVYEKYGTSPTGSCLYLLVQMPILFGLYQVIYKIPGYVVKVRAVYTGVLDQIVGAIGSDQALYNKFLEFYSANYNLANSKNHGIEAITQLAEDENVRNYIIDMLYNLKFSEWDTLAATFNIDISSSLDAINKMNTFLGVNLSQSPSTYVKNIGVFGLGLTAIAVLIPVLSGVLQFISVKMTTMQQEKDQGATKKSSEPGTMESSMKMMNNIMPIMSIVICFSLPTGLGIYWVASSVVRMAIQFFVNLYLKKLDIDVMVAKNIEKANKKREKKGLPPTRVSAVAGKNVKNIQSESEEQRKARESKDAEDRERRIKESSDFYSKGSSGKGKLSSRANMVKQYNEKHDN
ncbi:MAG: YidC/Oxa1 family membrane protein insertase [Lachnospiraceae bacterium]|nr:YidC/Oxa1 family membrane protein insertase [Lachnospiraceae bacterium]